MESDNKIKKNARRKSFVQSAAAEVAGVSSGTALSRADTKMKAGVKNTVTLEILEPHGELAFPERKGLFTPRLRDLNGKKIAIMAMFQQSPVFFDTIKSMLKNKYPGVEFVHFRYAAPNSPDTSAEIANACDGWIEGVKAAETGSRYDIGARLEKRGCPGVTIVSDAIVKAQKLLVDDNGMPTCRILSLPAVDYCAAKTDPKLMKTVAEAAFNRIHNALVKPLTKEEREVDNISYDYSPKKFTGSDYSEANEKFQQYCTENFLTDGMPVVPPTREAVDRMLAGTDYPPDKEIGLIFPKQGRATVEKIAISAVMAGAKPEYLPVIIAMIETITAKDFNQFHLVNEILPITFISGPIVEEIGLNNEVGYLAPGHRTNATIGRALLMCMINIGWRRMDVYSSPGGIGQPAAYANYIIPENQKASPWESYAVSNGFKPEESTVTICESLSLSRGPSETLDITSFEERLERMRRMFSHTGGIFRHGLPQNSIDMRHMVAIHPTFARQLANAGFTRESFIKWLHDKNTINWNRMSEDERKEFRKRVAEGKIGGIRPEDCKPGLYREPFANSKDVAVIVTGTGAGGVLVFQTACGSTANAEDVEVTRPYMHKVIRGATLTKAGR
jgi:hypothetical protein